MADNVEADAGTGGAVFATDDVTGVHYPISKLAFGALDSANLVTSTATNPFPVALSDTDNAVLDTIDAVLDTINAKLVTGTVIGDVNLGATDNAVLDAIAASVAAIDTDTSTIITAVQLIDDAVYIDDADWTDNTSKHLLVGGAYQSAPHTVTDGDVTPFLTDVNGRLEIANAGLTELAAAISTEVQCDIVGALPAGTNAIGKLAANSGVDIGDVDILSIAAGDNNIGNVDVASLPASTNTLEVVGDVAHDAGAAGNPVLICGVAQASDDTAPPNRISTESDATRLATDFDGAIYARPHGPQLWSYHDDDAAAVTTDGTVHAAPGAGLSLYVTDIVFSIGAATASSIFFEESTTKVLGPYYLEAIAGRGTAIHFQTPKKITANTALLVTNTGSITFSVDVTGFVGQG